MTDLQLEALKHTTWSSIYLVGQWLNSAAMWELVGLFLGLILIVSFITMIISRTFGMFHFRTRD